MPIADPQPDTRTVGRAARATCEGAVSYDLSGERLTERGLSGRPYPAPGPGTRRASAGQTVERSCGACRTVYDVAPMTNETLAWTGSYGPFPESGLTVLARRK